MSNPYQSPETKWEPQPPGAVPERSLQQFCAWYFGAFIVCAGLFSLSRYVSQVDLLEIPLATLLFPWAAVLDPHDGMVNDRNMFLYGVGWWALMGAVAWAGRKYAPPLLVAFTLEFAAVVGAIGYTLFVHLTAVPAACC